MAYFQLTICFWAVTAMLNQLLGGDPLARTLKTIAAICTLVFAIFAIVNLFSVFNPFGLR